MMSTKSSTFNQEDSMALDANEIAVDVSGLNLGDQLTVADLALPAGVTTDAEADELVVTTLHNAPAEDEGAAEGEDAGEAAEG